MSTRLRMGLALVLIVVLLGVVGLLAYDRYFVPTTLVVCVDPTEKTKKVVIQSREKLLARELENGVARFEKIRKGQWKIYFVQRDDNGWPFYVEKGEGMFDGIETRLYCPE